MAFTETAKHLTFRQLFALLFVAFFFLLTGSILQAWTGPTGTPPNDNVDAPVNVGTANQVKNGGLSVNALAVFGSSYVQNDLGINDANPVVALDVNGTVIIGNGGEVCQAVTAGALHYNTTTNTMEYCNGTAWQALATLGQPQMSFYQKNVAVAFYTSGKETCNGVDQAVSCISFTVPSGGNECGTSISNQSNQPGTCETSACTPGPSSGDTGYYMELTCANN